MTESISNLPERIFLCGFMGSGKSTIGRQLADELEQPFRDLDSYIEEQAGKSIPDIFRQEGEKHFRDLERRCLLKTVRSCSGVISLGGGALQNQQIVDHLKLKGLLIFIKTPFSIIFQRIEEDKNRPMLWNEQGQAGASEQLERDLRELYEQRLPLYRQAEITIETGPHDTVGEIVDLMINKIRNHVSYR
ncbi:MAG: shikimate kinase [Balneolaceae bacterium]|nr:shikimate kinase [Balneolaceae bacterium]